MALTTVKSNQIESSVTLAGSPTTTTQSASDSSTKIATTAYVDTAVAAADTSLAVNSNAMTGDGSDTTLTLAVTPSHEDNTQVFIGGIYQPKSTYSVSGTTLTFSTAPPSSSAVEAMTISNVTVSRNAMTGDNSDTTLTLAVTPSNENFTQVYVDGVYQPKSTYSVSGTTLTFSTAPPSSSAVEAITLSGSIDATLDTMTGDGSDTTLTLSTTPSDETFTQVYVDGVYQPKSTYSVSGTTLTFSAAPPNSTGVEVITLSAGVAGIPLAGSVTSAKIADDAVTAAKIADDAVGADQLASNAVVTASMVNDAVTAAKIADDAVGADQLASSAVVTASIVNDAVTADKIADNSVDIARLNVSDGTAGQALTTNGSGTLAFATIGGAFNDFAIKTGNYTAVTKDQLIVNSSSAVTITLPSSPSAGNVVFIKNAGTGTVTVARNGSNINSTADNGELAADAGATLVYVNSTIGWKEL